MVRYPPAMQEAQDLPDSGRSPGEGNEYPLQYSFLENSIEEPVGLQYMESQRVRQN